MVQSMPYLLCSKGRFRTVERRACRQERARTGARRVGGRPTRAPLPRPWDRVGTSLCRAAQIAPHLDGGRRSRGVGRRLHLRRSPHRLGALSRDAAGADRSVGRVAVHGAARALARLLVHAPARRPEGSHLDHRHRAPERAAARLPPAAPLRAAGEAGDLPRLRLGECRAFGRRQQRLDVVDGRPGPGSRPRALFRPPLRPLRLRRHLRRARRGSRARPRAQPRAGRHRAVRAHAARLRDGRGHHPPLVPPTRVAGRAPAARRAAGRGARAHPRHPRAQPAGVPAGLERGRRNRRGLLPAAHDRQPPHGIRADGDLHRRGRRLPDAGGATLGPDDGSLRRAAGFGGQRLRAGALAVPLDLRHRGSALAARDRRRAQRRRDRGAFARDVLPPARPLAAYHARVLCGRARRRGRARGGDRLGRGRGPGEVLPRRMGAFRAAADVRARPLSGGRGSPTLRVSERPAAEVVQLPQRAQAARAKLSA